MTLRNGKSLMQTKLGYDRRQATHFHCAARDGSPLSIRVCGPLLRNQSPTAAAAGH